jgi:hypothetical protein
VTNHLADREFGVAHLVHSFDDTPQLWRAPDWRGGLARTCGRSVAAL